MLPQVGSQSLLSLNWRLGRRQPTERSDSSREDNKTDSGFDLLVGLPYLVEGHKTPFRRRSTGRGRLGEGKEALSPDP